MSNVWQTVRVFISSTFRDMQAERDWLVKRVFPELRQRLEAHRIYLVDIDLRWGITRQQSDNDQILGLCLQQIDECRPFFLGLLGERYGWVPFRFPEEVNKNYGWTQHHSGKSVTELEILHGVLNDQNMHGRALFCFRSEHFLDSITDEQKRRIFAESPTDEELRVLSPTESEYRSKKRFNQLTELKRRIKELSPTVPLYDGYPCQWNPMLIDPVSKTPGRLDGLNEFGDWVIEKLEHAILNAPELQQHLAGVHTETRNEHDEEHGFHEQFIENRTLVYIGRQQFQGELKTFVTSTKPKPCLVSGPSGSGKSAALAQFVKIWRSQHPQEIIISHFVGASSRSTDLREMLRHLCAELKDALKLEDEIKQDVRELSVQFCEFLEQRVPEDRFVVLVLDALNQLDETDNAHSLHWLPIQIPPQVRLMVSCIDDPDRPDQQALVAMRRRTQHEVTVGLLTYDERLGIIREIPSVAAKTLDEVQIGLLLRNPATKNPLFLLVALEELRGFGSFEELNRKIAGLPQTGDTLSAIFQQVIRRLREDFNAITVKDVLTLLACSRYGISERELLDLLEDGQECIEKSIGDLFPILRQLRPYLQSRGPLLDFYYRHLAKAIDQELFWPDKRIRAAIHLRLAEYFHCQENYLSSDRCIPNRVNTRKALELPYQLLRAASLRFGSDSALSNWNVLTELLTNREFLESKTQGDWARQAIDAVDSVGSSMVVDLLHDLQNTRKALPIAHRLTETIEVLEEFFSRHLIQLVRSPFSLASQLSIDFAGSEGKLEDLARVSSLSEGHPLIKRGNPALKRIVPRRIDLPFRSNIAAMACIPETSDVVICSQGGDIVRVDTQRRFIKVSAKIETQPLRCTLVGSEGTIYALGTGIPVFQFLDPISLSESGSLPVTIAEAGWATYSKSVDLIAIGGLDEMELFRPQDRTGKRVPYPERIKVPVSYGTNMVEFNCSGTYLAIACRSGDVLVYDLSAGQFIEKHGYCGRGALSLAFENETTLWVGSLEGNLLRWDFVSGQMCYYHANGDAVETLLWNDQEQQMISGHRSGSIRVWNASSSESLLNINLTTKWIRALAKPNNSDFFLVGTDEVILLPSEYTELRSINDGEYEAVASSFASESQRLLMVSGGAMIQFTETDRGQITPFASILQRLHANVDGEQVTITEPTIWEEPEPTNGTALCQAKQGNMCFIGFSDGTVLGHNNASSQTTLALLAESTPITAITCNLKGTRLIYAASRSLNVAELKEGSLVNYTQRARLGRSLKAFPLLMFIGEDHFLFDAGQPLDDVDTAGTESKVPNSILEIRRFMDLDKVSTLNIPNTLGFITYSTRHSCLIAIEGNFRYAVSKTSKLTGKHELKFGSFVPVSTTRYGIWKIRLGGIPERPAFTGKPELIAAGPLSAPVGIDVLDGLDLIAVLARDGSLTLWRFGDGVMVQEVALRSRGLEGPAVFNERRLLCADSGQGSELGPEIYNLEI